MRRPIHLKPFAPKSSQQGYALFIVLMIMIVIALLVVAAIQSYNTEQRISTNEADRKLATSLAETALRQGENRILDFDGKTVEFKENCQGSINGTPAKGLCAAPDTKVPAAYKDVIKVDSVTKSVWKENNNKLEEVGQEVSGIKSEDVSKNPVYIIEYISSDASQGSSIYRVTAKAWGKNSNTVVILQSYVANE